MFTSSYIVLNNGFIYVVYNSYTGKVYEVFSDEESCLGYLKLLNGDGSNPDDTYVAINVERLIEKHMLGDELKI